VYQQKLARKEKVLLGKEERKKCFGARKATKTTTKDSKEKK
jgi:hypothetical protein